MKQIILITDGCSNVGIDPVVAAAQAQTEQIVVNVIGVIDDGDIGEKGSEEIREIAGAGGGLSRIVVPRMLSRTMQMMTRKTVVSTIQQAVNKQLSQIMGDVSLTELEPEKRAKVVEVIDDLSETVAVRTALLIDTSASMKPKLPAVEEAIRDLMLNFRSRSGRSELAVFHFPPSPSSRTEYAEKLMDWTVDLAKIGNLFYKLSMKGTTPTGPALLQVVHEMTGGGNERDIRSDHNKQGDGLLCDYVV